MLPDVPYIPPTRKEWSPAHEEIMRAWIVNHLPRNAREALLGLIEVSENPKFHARSQSQTCRKCKQVIQWEQLGGMRLMRHVEKRTGIRIVYRTRCGCGHVNRDDKGRKIR